MAADTAPALIGRDQEVRALTELIGNGTTAGQALVVIGDPGIGKSALLGAAQDAAGAAGFGVLTTTGVESEAQLPFAGLHQILRPVLRSASRLRPAHDTALQAAFGLAEGPRPELFQIALAAVNLLAAVAAEQPLHVVDQNRQWLLRRHGDSGRRRAVAGPAEPGSPDVHRAPGRATSDGHRRGDADWPSWALPGRRAS